MADESDAELLDAWRRFNAMYPPRQAPDLAAEMDRALLQLHGSELSQLEPASDLYAGTYLRQQSLQRDQGLLTGVVKFAIPYYNCYRVTVDGLNGEVMAVASQGSTAIGAFGAVETRMIPLGSTVRLLWPAGSYHAVILCVEPQRVTDGNFCLSDVVSQGSNVGLFRDNHYKAYVTLPGDEGGAIDFSNNRPLDQLGNDYGFSFSTGIGLHADPLMTYLRASDYCGVFFFFDEHTRLAGRSLEIWSEAALVRQENDAGELQAYHGELTYPWELLGAFSAGVEVARDVSAEDVIYKTPEGPLEGVQAGQKPFARYEEYGGYLGQGHIRQMSVPPPGVTSDVNAYGSTTDPLCVFREHVDLDGSVAISAAKNYVISKRLNNPHPFQKRLPADQRDDSDGPTNYKASGTYGAGPAHQVGDVKRRGELPHQLAMAACFDVHTHAANWKTLAAFRYHKGDYRTPEESALIGKVGKNQTQLSYGQLAAKAWLEPPAAKSLYVDHIRGSVDVYEIMSHIALTDEGGIVLQSGLGGEIRISEAVQLAAPANVYVQPGKSFVVLAGDDACIRARNSVDLTADKKDARVKAGKNVMIGAAMGPDQIGCLLLECRSYGKEQEFPDEGGEKIKGTGVIVKTEHSDFNVLAGGMYFRTCGPGLDDGNIVFDLNNGRKDIITISRQFIRFVKDKFLDAFGFENVGRVNEFNQARALLGSSLWIDGSVRVTGQILARRDIYSSAGHVSSIRGGQVGRILDPAPLERELTEVASTEKQSQYDLTKRYDTDVTTPYKKAKKIGNEEQLKKVSFSLRTMKDYGTEDCLLPQTYWQYLATAGGAGGVEAWDEKPVKYQDAKEMLPWPGKEPWDEQESLLVLDAQNVQFFDPGAGVAKNIAAAPYETPFIGPFRKATPKSEYMIITSPGE